MLRTALLIQAVAVGAFGVAVAGCGANPAAAQPIVDAAVVDVQGTTDVQRDAERESELAPVCGESCQETCPCCGCMAGDVRMVGSDVLVCNQAMSCFQRVADASAD
jgi:hypothetical protein